MLHSGCVKLHQKFRDFVGLPMGLLREEIPKSRMNPGLFGSRSGEYGSITVAPRERCVSRNFIKELRNITLKEEYREKVEMNTGKVLTANYH